MTFSALTAHSKPPQNYWYQQGEKDTCASSSLASCFHYIGYENLAEYIEQYGIALESQEASETDKFLPSLVNDLQRNRQDFRKKYEVRKLIPTDFDIFCTDSTFKSTPKLLQLLGSDGGCAHAVTIYNGLLFDSNLKFAVDLTREYLEFSIDANYIGILHGYDFKPHSFEMRLKKKRKKKPCNSIQHQQCKKQKTE